MTDPTNLENLKQDWPKLLEKEELAFDYCVGLDKENPNRNPEKSEAVREWWCAANAVLWMFTRTRAQFNHELQPFPAFTFGRLANISEELSNGNLPSLVSDAAGTGRKYFLMERHHIAYGVLYIEAVKRGEIQDKSPNKTVRQAYNVTAKTVQNWMKRRDEMCVGVPHEHLSPDKLKLKMLECAGVYSHIGRGAPSEN